MTRGTMLGTGLAATVFLAGWGTTAFAHVPEECALAYREFAEAARNLAAVEETGVMNPFDSELASAIERFLSIARRGSVPVEDTTAFLDVMIDKAERQKPWIEAKEVELQAEAGFWECMSDHG